MKTTRRYSNTTIATGASTAPRRSFDGAQKAKGLFGAFLSIAALTAPLALHAQSVSFAGIQTTVPAQGLGNKTTSVAVDASGNIYIADNANSQIVKLTPAGVQTSLLKGNVFDITQLAVDSAGNLFILDDGTPGSIYLATPQIKELTTSGSLLKILSQGMGQAEGLAIDNAEDILSDNDTIGANYVQWASYGTPTSSWNTVYNPVNPNPDLPPPTPNPANLAMGPFNPASGIQTVFFPLTATGQVVGVPGYFSSGKVSYKQSQLFTVASGLNYPLGVAVDGTGNVFISNTNSNSIVELPFAGNNSSGLPTYGSQIKLPISGLNRPNGLAVDAAGNLYIADENNSRVLEMQLHSANFGAVNACPSGQTTPAPCSNTLTLTFSVTASGTLGPPQVMTQGKQPAPRNTDFTLASGSTCSGTVTEGSTCTVNVTFTPQFPGQRTGSVRLIDSDGGEILATILLSGNGQGPQAAFSQTTQSTVVSVKAPTGVAVDEAGNVFIATNSIVQVLGQVQAPPALGLGGANTLALDGNEDIFIADPANNRVLEVAAKTEAQTTVGTGLSSPSGVAVDGAGDVFIADSGNNRVVEISPLGIQTTVPASGLNFPYGVAVDSTGDVFIADSANSRVVEVSADGIQTTVGSGLNFPQSVAVDTAGNVFIADAGLGELVEVSAGGSQTTLGTGLKEPYSVALDGAGDVFVADTVGNRVVEVKHSPAASLSFSLPVGESSAPQSVTVENIGNQPLNASGLSVSGSNFEQVEDTSPLEDCSSIVSLAGGASCNLSIIFWQSSTGSFSGSAVLTDNSLNSTSATQTVKLTGTAQ
jgi:large repetitive protein